MADERDFELLDDYLTQRMSEGDRSAFEQKLQADPDLQNEYSIQQRLIKGIKEARVAELKAMLNQVPIPSNAPGSSMGTKILLGAVITMLVATLGYWYFTRDEINVQEPAVITQQPAETPKPAVEESVENAVPDQEPEATVEKPVAEQEKNQTSAGTEHSKPSLAKKPDPLQAPTGVSSGTAENSDSFVETSAIEIKTDATDSRYSFHYQLKEGTLVLYGAFDEGYKALEYVENDRRSPVLRFKEQYYLLEPDKDQVQPLTPVTDAAMIRKLNEYTAQ